MRGFHFAIAGERVRKIDKEKKSGRGKGIERRRDGEGVRRRERCPSLRSSEYSRAQGQSSRCSSSSH